MFDDFLTRNQAFASSFRHGDLTGRPTTGLALITCMDVRIDPLQALGVEIGDVTIIRNAGGRASTDALRSLSIAVALLGVRAAIVMHHTLCGIAGTTNARIAQSVASAGAEPAGVDFLAIEDPKQALQNDVDAIRTSALVPPLEAVAGWMYDVTSGRITQIIPA